MARQRIEIYFTTVLVSVLLVSACGFLRPAGEAERQSSLAAADEPTVPFQVASANGVRRSFPKLVNYFHMNLSDSHIQNLEERLARWDVLILNPDDVITRGLSLEKIRRMHPAILLLAWIPFGQEPDPSMEIAQAAPAGELETWYAKTVGRAAIVPVWGGHLMNPYKDNFKWPEHVAQFVKTAYLDDGHYDGIMFDILSEWAPTFASQDLPPTLDVNEDGVFNNQDHKDWQAGVIHLLQRLRASNPSAILTGNGGVPWSKECPYAQYANGDMHENALGNEFGSHQWQNRFASPYGVWDGIRAIFDSGAATAELQRIHFLSVDLRLNRDYNAAKYANGLTENDLQRMRLGLCTSLLEDAVYFGFDRGDSLHGQLWWFNEYDAPLGNPVEKYEAGLFGSGIYSRKFENGLVIVNPGSSKLRVRLGTPHRDVTTGKRDDRFTIPPMDARIYIL